jgi:hypothetical protein
VVEHPTEVDEEYDQKTISFGVQTPSYWERTDVNTFVNVMIDGLAADCAGLFVLTSGLFVMTLEALDMDIPAVAAVAAVEDSLTSSAANDSHPPLTAGCLSVKRAVEFAASSSYLLPASPPHV